MPVEEQDLPAVDQGLSAVDQGLSAVDQGLSAEGGYAPGNNKKPGNDSGLNFLLRSTGLVRLWRIELLSAAEQDLPAVDQGLSAVADMRPTTKNPEIIPGLFFLLRSTGLDRCIPGLVRLWRIELLARRQQKTRK